MMNAAAISTATPTLPPWQIFLRTDVIDNISEMIQNTIVNRSNSASGTLERVSSGPPTVYVDGPLPFGYHLLHPVYALVLQDDDEIIVTEPRFHIHGYGPSLREAENDFLHVLAESYDVLRDDEQRLDPYLQGQLAYLRSVISAQ